MRFWLITLDDPATGERAYMKRAFPESSFSADRTQSLAYSSLRIAKNYLELAREKHPKARIVTVTVRFSVKLASHDGCAEDAT